MKRMFIVVLLASFVSEASAFYNPGKGRWTSRDPIGEPGFETIRNKPPNVRAGEPNLYLFVRNSPVNKVDAFGLKPLLMGSGCPCGEPLAQANAVGLPNALRARRLANEALLAAQQSGLPGLHNGLADAFRHCFWSCRMAQELNPGVAGIIGDIHERCGNNPPGEEAMDLANNSVGRSLGEPGAECNNLCIGAIYDGALVLEPGGSPPGQLYDYYY